MKTGIYWQDPEYPAKGMGFIFDPSLVLYLPLHRLDGASFMSRDKHGHLCTAGKSFWTPQGHSFDGLDDYILCPDHAAVKPTSAMTILAWVKCPLTPSAYEHVVSKQDAAASGYRLALTNTGKVQIAFYDGAEHEATSLTELAGECWYFLAGAWDGSTISIDVNGNLENSTPWEGTITANTLALYLGAYAKTPTSGNLGGLLGEVWLYRRGLTFPKRQNFYLATKWRYR